MYCIVIITQRSQNQAETNKTTKKKEVNTFMTHLRDDGDATTSTRLRFISDGQNHPTSGGGRREATEQEGRYDTPSQSRAVRGQLFSRSNSRVGVIIFKQNRKSNVY